MHIASSHKHGRKPLESTGGFLFFSMRSDLVLVKIKYYIKDFEKDQRINFKQFRKWAYCLSLIHFIDKKELIYVIATVSYNIITGLPESKLSL